MTCSALRTLRHRIAQRQPLAFARPAYNCLCHEQAAQSGTTPQTLDAASPVQGRVSHVEVGAGHVDLRTQTLRHGPRHPQPVSTPQPRRNKPRECLRASAGRRQRA
eukprot:1000214-Rhodomonas_salina.6